MLIDMGPATADPDGRSFRDFRLSYLDDGDGLDLARFRPEPGMGKRRPRKREIAYRAPARSRRNVFGAYTLYDLMARLVLGDPASYSIDHAEAFDARSGDQRHRRDRAPAAPLQGPHRHAGERPQDVGAELPLLDHQRAPQRHPPRRPHRQPRPHLRHDPEPRGAHRAPRLLAAHRPTRPCSPAPWRSSAPAPSASSPPPPPRPSAPPPSTWRSSRSTASTRSTSAITIDTVDYAAQNHELLDEIAGLRGILFCGGNQIRLVETLLHRGEESAVLRAIANAHAHGAVLIAASGAASALSGVMIAGGSSYEALRYGVSSDTGHRGLVIQEGIGLFAGGIVDQNLIGGNRLGRLVVACAEESERFGIGVFEDSAVIASHAGTRLQATGQHGFLLVEIDLTALELQSDSFVARGVRLTALGPGDTVDLATGAIEREASTDATAALLARLIDGLAGEAGPNAAGARSLQMHTHAVERRRGSPRPGIPARRVRLAPLTPVEPFGLPLSAGRVNDSILTLLLAIRIPYAFHTRSILHESP